MTAFVRIKELGEGSYKFLVNELPQSLPVFVGKIPVEWKKKHAELRWKHRTHGGVNHIVIGKDLAGYFPKVLSTKGHMVLSRSAITGNLIISGRMKTMLGEDSSTFNNRTIVRQVDPYLKMLSTDLCWCPLSRGVPLVRGVLNARRLTCRFQPDKRIKSSLFVKTWHLMRTFLGTMHPTCITIGYRICQCMKRPARE